LIHTVTITRGPTGVAGTGRDTWGEPVDAATPASFEVPARMEWRTKRFFDSSGQEVTAVGRIYLPPNYLDPGGNRVQLELGPEDTIFFEGKEYRVVQRDRLDGWGWATDPRAHWEVWVV